MPDYQDPTRFLGNMQNHQKMYDFERDILRVKNPLTTDFTFIYDMLPITVPSQGTLDIERYLVRRYIWAMIGHIYEQLNEARIEKAHEAFSRTQPDVIDDPYLLNTKIYDRLPRSDDPKFQEQVIKDCIIGVVKKYGSDRQIPKQVQNGRLDPNTPLYMTLIDGFKTLDQNSQLEVPAQPSQNIISTATQPLG
jgi:hypothetical protein